jgi:hypothetical protein
MGTINQNVEDKLLIEFYNKARNKFGDKKGCKQKALIEAIQQWNKKNK